jgi:M6 family metalloprotease-like protein
MKFAASKFTWSILIVLVFCPLVEAVPPFPGLNKGPGPKEHVHKIPNINSLRALGLNEKSIQLAIGATGTKKVAVIIVNFSSAGSTTSGSAQMSDGEFKNISTLMSNLRAYYLEVSGNLLTVEPTYIYSSNSNGSGGITTKTFPNALSGNASSEYPIMLNRAMEYYGGNDESGINYLFSDAVNATGITTSSYDALMVIHSGYGEETTSNDGDIWSLFSTISPSANGFSEGMVVPVKEKNNITDPFGAICHEFGHQIGLPDLYNTVNILLPDSTVVGNWCLMDSGSYAGNPSGTKPSHPSVWCKKLLGWVTPTITSGTKTLTVNNIEQNRINSAYQFNVLNSTTEYFLIEYRKKHLYDESLPGEGILIWHIDDSMGDISKNNINNNSLHPRVKLIEADKSNTLTATGDNTRSDRGTQTDVFRTSSNVFSMPESNSYSNVSSGITLANFSGVGENAMTLGSYVLASSEEFQAKKSFGFPNPSRDNQSIRIRTIFTRTIVNGNIKIYTVAGELIKEDSTTNFNIVMSASKDYEWVYEYVWDLTNSSGNFVSAGVYIYVVEASISDTEKQVKVGKVSIIK